MVIVDKLCLQMVSGQVSFTTLTGVTAQLQMHMLGSIYMNCSNATNVAHY